MAIDPTQDVTMYQWVCRRCYRGECTYTVKTTLKVAFPLSVQAPEFLQSNPTLVCPLGDNTPRWEKVNRPNY